MSRSAVEQYIEQESFANEGRRGLEGLCQLARAIGYKDPLYFGAISHKAAVGDFIEFLSDNPGCVEAIRQWVIDQDVAEWNDNVEGLLLDKEEDEDEDEDDDCNG